MYCIYSDTDTQNGNWDHIYPLSCGGADEFVIWSDEQTNSVIGSQVDGAITKDPLVSFALRNSGVTGLSNKQHISRWRHVSLEDGRPAQVTWGVDEVIVWDARAKRALNEAEVAGMKMSAKLRIEKHAALRFLAKVALGGGYFLYGDTFRTAVDCKQLRELIFLDLDRIRKSGVLGKSEIAVCDRFHPDAQDGGKALLYRKLCEGTDRSIFIATPHHTSITFHVGIVGMYMGSIIVPAVTDNLPIDGEHDLGHALILAPGNFERLSFRELITDYHRAMTEFAATRDTRNTSREG
jgi:hypothetical protein